MAPLSIVIPVGPKETGLELLLKDLEQFVDCEVILVGIEKLNPTTKIKNLKCLVSKIGRGVQLNTGALNCTGEYIWFLHADSRLKQSAYKKLLLSLERFPEDIHYFDLKFSGSRKMAINEWGVKIRSDLFGMPFGDQGIAVKKEVFKKIGSFPLNSAEDHHFIWQAKLKGHKLRNTGAKIFTSARKYEENGHIRTTLKHLYLTFKQALPYILKS
jgi:glycosyltransferase involved in cell wall biosynthesis